MALRRVVGNTWEGVRECMEDRHTVWRVDEEGRLQRSSVRCDRSQVGSWGRGRGLRVGWRAALGEGVIVCG